MISNFLQIFVIVVVLNMSCFVSGTIPLKPNGLRPGDTLAFVSPGSTVHAAFSNIEQYKTHITSAMTSLGWNVVFSPNAFVDGPSGLAGNDSQRASDIMWAFSNPDVQGIIANRGGWGCNRLVDLLDYGVIQNNPKIFMGYSDITGCLMAITSQTDLVTFHGPVGTSSWGNLNSDYMTKVLQGEADTLFRNPTSSPTTTVIAGKARGRLIGGNLSVFVALLGSPFIPSLDEPYILFLEDVGENPYRVDRMLTTLHLAGYFKNASGLIFGTCSNCNPDAPGRWTVLEIVQQKWGRLNMIPSYYGALIGHGGQQFTLPIGSQVEMDAGEGTITLLEAAAIPDVPK